MHDFFASGRVADLVLAVLALEALGLWGLRRWAGRGPGLSRSWPFLVAGGFLVLALRGALTGAEWSWIGAALVGAGVAHAVQLVRGA